MESADFFSGLTAVLEHRRLLDFPSWSAAGILSGYLLVMAVLHWILPGPIIPGVELADNTRRYYKCNGFSSLLLLLAVSAAAADFLPLKVLADRGGQLLTTSLIFSLVISLIVYIIGCKSGSATASLKSHSSGNILHDWWFGVQLNPSFFGLDLKFFTIKAGMVGWFLLNVSIAEKQYENQGSLSLPMTLYQAFSMIYVLDYFWFEEYMTSTWDIIAEKFGYMLIFGDLVWIPFTFSIQGWWLLKHKVDVTIFATILNVLIFLLGYAVFRGANKQKHDFKKDHKSLIWGKPPRTIGGKLLVSGYWGIARHCNYLGDIIVAFSFSLPCGASSAVPYFYPAYLLILLIWRERRDESRCKEKYKDIWEDYCRVVRWRIFPYLY